MATPYLRLGTRGSPLALVQAHEAQARLAATGGREPRDIEIVVIRTSGDMIVDRPLSEAGGKGLFTKELDEALIAGQVDFAVHSAKDLPTVLPAELGIAGYMEREDPRDALICATGASLKALPPGARFGSASLRRRAMALRLRPDLEVWLLRGNVETRLKKVESGQFDATILALAGLKRLGLEARAAAVLSTDEFLPAVGQGAIALVARGADRRVAEALAPILDAPTAYALAAERAFLDVLDGSCRTPIGAHARLVGQTLSFRGLVLSPDGREAVEIASEGPCEAAEKLGFEAGREIKARALAIMAAA
jgi:hydroxymethylbilane synthase